MTEGRFLDRVRTTRRQCGREAAGADESSVMVAGGVIPPAEARECVMRESTIRESLRRVLLRTVMASLLLPVVGGFGFGQLTKS